MFGFWEPNHLNWAVGCIGFGFVGVGLTNVASITLTYVIDSYYPVAAEVMLVINATKNVVACGVLYGTVPWVANSGYQNVGLLPSIGLLDSFANRIASKLRLWCSHWYLLGSSVSGNHLLLLRCQDPPIHFHAFQAHLLASRRDSVTEQAKLTDAEEDFCA